MKNVCTWIIICVASHQRININNALIGWNVLIDAYIPAAIYRRRNLHCPMPLELLFGGIRRKFPITGFPSNWLFELVPCF